MDSVFDAEAFNRMWDWAIRGKWKMVSRRGQGRLPPGAKRRETLSSAGGNRRGGAEERADQFSASDQGSVLGRRRS